MRRRRRRGEERRGEERRGEERRGGGGGAGGAATKTKTPQHNVGNNIDILVFYSICINLVNARYVFVWVVRLFGLFGYSVVRLFGCCLCDCLWG